MSDEDTGAGPDSGAVHRLEHEIGAHAETDLHGLRQTFAERHLSLRTMDAPLRLATAGAIASLVGTCVLLLLRDSGGAGVRIGETAGVQVTLSSSLFVAALVMLALGFGYLTTGVVLSHPLGAFIGLAAITVGIGYETGALGPFGNVLPRTSLWTSRALLSAVWVLAIAVTLWRRRRHGDAEQDRTLRLLVLIGFCALYGAYLLLLRVSNPTVHGLNIFPSSIHLLMGGIAILTTPILAMAAVDFGEWGQLSGERVLGLVVGSGPVGRIGRWLVPAAGCTALLVIAWKSQSAHVGNHLYRVMQSVILVAVVVAIMIAAGALLRVQRRAWPETLNFAGILVVVALTYSIVPTLVGHAQGLIKVVAPAEVSASGEFTAAASVQSLHGSSGFTMLVPLAWSQSTTATGSDVFSGANYNYGELLLVVEHRTLGPSDSIQSFAASAGLGAPQGSAKTEGDLQFLALTPTSQYRSADIWLRKGPGKAEANLFIGASFAVKSIPTKSDPPGAARLLGAIVHSFRPPGTAPAGIPTDAAATPAYAAQATSDRLNLVSDAVDLVLTLIALSLMACVSRAWSGRVRGAILLLGAVTLTGILFDLGALSRVLFGGRTRLLPGIGVPGLLFGVGILGLITLAVAGLRRSPWSVRVRRNLTGLVVGVLALRGMETLYDRALSASRVAVWAAIIVLVAMAWDIAMSGESMTNHASKLVPRSSRIFLFFGYVILLACAIVFFSGQHTAGSGSALKEALFEPEAITQSGLFLVAAPLLLLLFLLRTFGEQEPARAVHGPPTSPSPAGGEREDALDQALLSAS